MSNLIYSCLLIGTSQIGLLRYVIKRACTWTVSSVVKNAYYRAGEMAQQLRAYTVLAEDELRSQPSGCDHL